MISPGEVLADGVTIHCRDFRLCDIPPFNHLITDCPYEQRSHDATGSIRRSDGIASPAALSFNGVDDLRRDLVTLAKDKCSGWSLWFCTTEGVALWRDEIELQGLKYKTPLIWNKPDSLPKMNGQGPSHGHECIATAWCGPGYSKWNGGGRRGMFTHMVNPPERDGTHPTQKPLSLMMELVSLFTNPGDLVCDSCMGSGSTALACIRLGRRFVGCEIDPVYYQAAKGRILKELQQPNFFVDIPKLKQGKLPL